MIRTNAAFTLIELLLAILCLAILLGPVFRVFRSGTHSTLKGMLQIETTMEARRILRQVESDLQAACYALDGKQVQVNWKTLLSVSGDLPLVTYEFLKFPHQGEILDCLPSPSQGNAFRLASRIRYRVETNPEFPFLRRLFRSETFHPQHPLAGRTPGGILETVLTDRLNLLEIRPSFIESGSHSLLTFRVILQLADSTRKEEIPGTVGGTFGIQRPTFGSIADFFEVITSEFYNQMIHRRNFNPNWHTGIQGP